MDLVELPWQRAKAGYRIEERQRESRSWHTPIINGLEQGGLYLAAQGPETPFVLTGLKDDVALGLANMVQTPDGALAFAKQWGLLRSAGEQEIGSFYRASIDIKSLFKVVEEKRWRDLEDFFTKRGVCQNTDFRLRKQRGEDRPVAVIRPQHLLSFCWAQAVQIVCSGGRFRSCRSCGQFFAIREGGRSTRTYCDDKCRQHNHRAGKQLCQRR